MTRMRNGSHAAQYLWWRVLIVASCVLAFALRRWPNVKEPTFWAEDGTTFFLGARVSGLASVVEHSSGYLHVPARLVALFADLFPAAGAPTIYTATALLAVGWTLWTVLSIAWPIGVRAAFCVAVAVVPHGGHTMHVLVNAHWWLTLGLLAVTLDRLTRSAESPSTTRRDVAWIVIAGLSGPHVLMLTPLWFWAAVRERSRASWTLLACVVAVALIQFLMLRSSWDPSLAGPPPDWEGVQRLFLGAYAAGLFAGPIDYAQHLNTCSVLAAAFWLFFLSVPLWLSGRARWFAMGAMFVVFANLAALAVRGGGSLEGLSAFGAGATVLRDPLRRHDLVSGAACANLPRHAMGCRLDACCDLRERWPPLRGRANPEESLHGHHRHEHHRRVGSR